MELMLYANVEDVGRDPAMSKNKALSGRGTPPKKGRGCSSGFDKTVMELSQYILGYLAGKSHC